MDQFQAWVGNEPAGPARETWDDATQDAVSAGLAAWLTDCVATAINGSTAPVLPTMWQAKICDKPQGQGSPSPSLI
jgi:hypothetical protein